MIRITKIWHFFLLVLVYDNRSKILTHHKISSLQRFKTFAESVLKRKSFIKRNKTKTARAISSNLSN